jgi:hypothetical protein
VPPTKLAAAFPNSSIPTKSLLRLRQSVLAIPCSHHFWQDCRQPHQTRPHRELGLQKTFTSTAIAPAERPNAATRSAKAQSFEDRSHPFPGTARRPGLGNDEDHRLLMTECPMECDWIASERVSERDGLNLLRELFPKAVNGLLDEVCPAEIRPMRRGAKCRDWKDPKDAGSTR